MAGPSVIAVVLNWNSAVDSIACLTALARGSFANCRPLVVDSGSSDDSVARIRAAFPAVPLLELGANAGYAGGNNRAIEHIGDACDYVWLLNPDTEVAPDCLAELVAAAEAQPRAALLGPLVLMREDRRRILSAGGVLGKSWSHHRACGELDAGQFTAPQPVDYVSGCALLVRRSALTSIGLLDERYFLYHEEVDWCQRARAAGYLCLVVPRARAWHPDTRARDVDSPLVTYYIVRNQLLFIRKHRLGTAMLARHLARHARTLTSWSLRPKWRHKAPQRRALARALLDFATGRSGKAPSGTW